MRFKSIKTPLAIVLCLSALLPLAILGGEVTVQSRRMVEAATKESLALAYADLDHTLRGVIGMLNVLGPDGDPSQVRAEIIKITVGKTGYVYVVDPKGRYVVSKGGARDGESLWEAKDANGRLFVQEVVRKGLALAPGEIGEERYPWANAGDPAPREKVVRLAHYAPRGWIVGVGSYVDEFMEAPARIGKLAAGSSLTMFATGAAALLAAIAVSLLFGSSIVKKLKKAAGTLERLAAGDVDARFAVESKDEFAQMAAAIGTVSAAVKTLVKETSELTEAVIAGRVTSRCGTEGLSGAYRALAQGFNEVLDALMGYFDALPTPVMIIDDEFSIRYMNKAGASLGNTTGEELAASGRKCHDFFKTGDCRGERCACARAMQSGSAAASETRAVPLDKAFDIAYNAIPILDRRGKVRGALEIVVDQTEAKRAERAMRKVSSFQDEVIASLNAYLLEVSKGDLSGRFSVRDGDEEVRETKRALDSLAESLNATVDSISAILEEVSGSVAQLGSASGQIAEASQALSQGATDQAGSLEETTSSVVSIASRTKRNAESALKANVLAKDARMSAERGNERMRELVTGMADINASAEEISKIVKSIDDISFQINLLALNANVEAARAGKYGKGFTVVAEEVRNLAVRAALSVKETTGMVEKAIANIDRGNKLVAATAEHFEDILKGSAESSGLTEEVADASREQSRGLEQITLGLGRIDQVTQANTSSAEETAAAAEEMSSQARQLKTMVARFKLREREPEFAGLSRDRLRAMIEEAEAGHGAGSGAVRRGGPERRGLVGG